MPFNGQFSLVSKRTKETCLRAARALLQLPGLDVPDLFSTISGWPSPNFSVSSTGLLLAATWPGRGELSAGPLSPVLHGPRV